MPKIKQLIEDAVNESFDGEIRESILGLVAYMRKSKMNPVQSYTNSWICRHKENVVCRFNLDGNVMRVGPIVDEYDSCSIPDEMKELVWQNVKNRACGEFCHGRGCGYKIDVFFGSTPDLVDK